MELIPILSFIILVATISTFILAIGAYILYKIRESKGRRVNAVAPRTIEAEMLTPAQAMMPQDMSGQPRRAVYQEPYYPRPDMQNRPAAAQTSQERAYQQQRGGAQVPAQSAYIRQQEYSNPNGQIKAEGEYDEAPADKKFMKYTSEGYVPVNKATKSGENLKWR